MIDLYRETCLLPVESRCAAGGPGVPARGSGPKSAKSVDLRGHLEVKRQKSVHIGVSIGKKFECAVKKVNGCQSIQ